MHVAERRRRRGRGRGHRGRARGRRRDATGAGPVAAGGGRRRRLLTGTAAPRPRTQPVAETPVSPGLARPDPRLEGLIREKGDARPPLLIVAREETASRGRRAGRLRVGGVTVARAVARTVTRVVLRLARPPRAKCCHRGVPQAVQLAEGRDWLIPESTGAHVVRTASPPRARAPVVVVAASSGRRTRAETSRGRVVRVEPWVVEQTQQFRPVQLVLRDRTKPTAKQTPPGRPCLSFSTHSRLGRVTVAPRRIVVYRVDRSYTLGPDNLGRGLRRRDGVGLATVGPGLVACRSGPYRLGSKPNRSVFRVVRLLGTSDV